MMKLRPIVTKFYSALYTAPKGCRSTAGSKTLPKFSVNPKTKTQCSETGSFTYLADISILNLCVWQALLFMCQQALHDGSGSM